ncbi:MAG: hypothetical protein KAS17_09395, partial [Victivallaceae bacterium]|nr:hypothetical protein [Victivallaceae bacterium]
MVVKENYEDKIVGHASMDSTAINGREKACRKNTPKKELKKKKRERKSKAEFAAMKEQELGEVKTRRLELQPNRNLDENLVDLPIGCDWSNKRNSKGKGSLIIKL